MPFSERWKRNSHNNVVSTTTPPTLSSSTRMVQARRKSVGFTSIADTESESTKSDGPAVSSSSSSSGLRPSPLHDMLNHPTSSLCSSSGEDDHHHHLPVRSYSGHQSFNHSRDDQHQDGDDHRYLLPQSSTGDPSEVSVLSHNNNNITPPEQPQSTSWWMEVIQQLQTKYESQVSNLQSTLHETETKKSLYKSELRSNIAVQLAWLEDRMTSPRHVLPAAHSQESNETTPSKTNNNDNGVEVTLSQAQHLQRLLTLEDSLQETTQLYEQTSVQHETERVSHHQQRRAWKEKIRVLTELLELTEAQHASELQQWQCHTNSLEQSLADMIADKNECVQKSEALEMDNLRLREQVLGTTMSSTNNNNNTSEPLPTLRQAVEELQGKNAALESQTERLELEKENLVSTWQSQLERVRHEKDNVIGQLRRQIADMQKQLQQTSVADDASWQDALDKVTAERDLYQQELNKLDNENIMASYQESVAKHIELVNRLKKLEAQRSGDRSIFQMQLETKANELEKCFLEKQALEEALEEQGNQHALELVALKNKIIEYESVRKSHQVRHGREVEELRHKVQQLETERDRAMDDIELLERSRNEQSMQQLSEMSEQYARNEQELADKLEHCRKEYEGKIRELNVTASEFKTLHSRAVKRYERVVTEKNTLQQELDNLRKEQVGSDHERTTTQQKVLLESIDSLRDEFHIVRETVEASNVKQEIETANFESFRQDLSNIQHSLNDAVAELTLEADALLESRDAIKTATSDLSTDERSQSRVLERQEQVLKAIEGIRESMSTALTVPPRPELSRELVDELKRTEANLAIAETELKHAQEKLELEIALRQKAQAEVEFLTQQGDAFEEQLMFLQTVNTKLMRQLQLAGLKIDTALLTTQMPPGYCMSPSGALRRSEADESIPELEQALALANDITNIVNGDGGTALEMLQSMSDVMEIHEKNSQDSACTPQRNQTDDSSVDVVRETLFADAETERPPMPVETPMLSADSTGGNIRTLQLVVEQLYGRCQLLERERTQLMESTLDLLEKARDASEAEIEAAVATARRRATEEILSIQQQNRSEEERIFQRLCRQCVGKKED